MSKRRTIYIAGPMTGIEDYNYPAFDRTAQEWAGRGWAVLNPADHFLRDQKLSMEHYMRGAIHAMLQADAIALMPEWMPSAGATMEAIIAERLSLEAYESDTAKQMKLPTVRFADTPFGHPQFGFR